MAKRNSKDKKEEIEEAEINIQDKTSAENKEKEVPICGIVMPISPIDNCTTEHWLDVREVISSTIKEAGFRPEIVSESDEIGVIHKRIIQNLYNNPILVCDVSGKNLNVMFELGMRLAFDQPTIVIKDDQTKYSFDIAPLEHLEYPRDLRHNKIEEFKENLQLRLEKTYLKSIEDPNYSTFLKNFGDYKIAELDNKEVSSYDFIVKEIKGLRRDLDYTLKNERRSSSNIHEQFQDSFKDKYSSKHRNHLTDLIRLSKNKEFFDTVTQLYINDLELVDKIILLSSKYFNLYKQHTIQVISIETYNSELNAIRKEMIDLVNELEDKKII